MVDPDVVGLLDSDVVPRCKDLLNDDVTDDNVLFLEYAQSNADES